MGPGPRAGTGQPSKGSAHEVPEDTEPPERGGRAGRRREGSPRGRRPHPTGTPTSHEAARPGGRRHARTWGSGPGCAAEGDPGGVPAIRPREWEQASPGGGAVPGPQEAAAHCSAARPAGLPAPPCTPAPRATRPTAGPPRRGPPRPGPHMGPGHCARRWPWLRGCKLPARSLVTPCSVPCTLLPAPGPSHSCACSPECSGEEVTPLLSSWIQTDLPGGGGHLHSLRRPLPHASLVCAHLLSPKAPPPVLVCHLPGQQVGGDKGSVRAGPGRVWASQCLVLSIQHTFTKHPSS